MSLIASSLQPQARNLLRSSLPSTLTSTLIGASPASSSRPQSSFHGALSPSAIRAESAGRGGDSVFNLLVSELEKSIELSGGRKPKQVKGRYVDDHEADWQGRVLFGEDSWPVKPYSGRSIAVDRRSSVAQAYGQLSNLLRRNNVRDELRLQERYEKPNQERRRKMSERHRRRFADMVRKKVQLVMAIKARGA